MRYLTPLSLAATLFSATPMLAAEGAGSVAVVNAPLAHIAATLGGDALEIIFPIPAGIDPAYWKPEPEQVQLCQQADLILLNGAGYAGWAETEMLPRARLVDTTSAVRDQLIPLNGDGAIHKHGPEGEHAHDGAYAFTTWLDPSLAKAQVDAAAEAFKHRWPTLAPDIEEGRQALHVEINEMDAAFRAFFERNADRQIFVSHPVYQYLDRAYPGTFISLHWEPDADPGAEQWAAFEATLDSPSHPLMLWEAEPISATADRLHDLDVDFIVLSPMAGVTLDGDLFRALAAQTEH